MSFLEPKIKRATVSLLWQDLAKIKDFGGHLAFGGAPAGQAGLPTGQKLLASAAAKV